MRNVDSKLSGEREINKMIMSTILKNNLFKVHRNIGKAFLTAGL